MHRFNIVIVSCCSFSNSSGSREAVHSLSDITFVLINFAFLCK
jgi:hypothetical protein